MTTDYLLMQSFFLIGISGEINVILSIFWYQMNESALMEEHKQM